MIRTLLLLLCFALTASAKQPPNVVLVYVDDLGWAQTSVEMIPGRADTIQLEE